MTYKEALERIYKHALNKRNLSQDQAEITPYKQMSARMYRQGKADAYKEMLEFMQELSRETKKKGGDEDDNA